MTVSQSTKGLSRGVTEQMQTFSYQLDSGPTTAIFPNPTSEYLFHPAPGATYYLGAPSPDERVVSFYEWNWDDNQARAGVVENEQEASPQITWFDMPSDEKRIDKPTVWVSDDERNPSIQVTLNLATSVNIQIGADTESRECNHENQCHCVIQVLLLILAAQKLVSGFLGLKRRRGGSEWSLRMRLRRRACL
jgi:hypothetical protein